MALVGRVARAHGTRGEVIVNPETDFPNERFRVGEQLHVVLESGVEVLDIRAVRFQQGRPVVAFQGVETMTEAQRLAGRDLRIPEASLHELPAGIYYEHDLVGCTVVTAGGEALGFVAGVAGSAGNTWLEVGTGPAEILIPFAAAICVEIDMARRRIVVDPPEGLLEANRPGGEGRRRAAASR